MKTYYVTDMDWLNARPQCAKCGGIVGDPEYCRKCDGYHWACLSCGYQYDTQSCDVDAERSERCGGHS